jgi:hypothetical protein
MNVGIFIQITGTGSADKTVLGETQRKSMGRDAAILDAWQRTRNYLESFVLPSGRTVGEKAAGDEQYNKRLETLVHGAQIVSTQYDEDQTAVAVLRLDRRIIQNTLGTDYK